MAIVISRNDPAYDEAFLAGASVAFGVFDGVHEGHRFIIGEAVASAREEAARSAVITFDIDPDEMFAPGPPTSSPLEGASVIFPLSPGREARCVLTRYTSQAPALF